MVRFHQTHELNIGSFRYATEVQSTYLFAIPGGANWTVVNSTDVLVNSTVMVYEPVVLMWYSATIVDPFEHTTCVCAHLLSPASACGGGATCKRGTFRVGVLDSRCNCRPTGSMAIFMCFELAFCAMVTIMLRRAEEGERSGFEASIRLRENVSQMLLAPSPLSDRRGGQNDSVSGCHDSFPHYLIARKNHGRFDRAFAPPSSRRC